MIQFLPNKFYSTNELLTECEGEESGTSPRETRKIFQKMALPDFSITQSPFIIISKVRYAIIGQFPLQSFLFSHFDVIDEDGYQADDHTAYKVYRYISMIQIAGFIEMMEEWFDKTI